MLVNCVSKVHQLLLSSSQSSDLDSKTVQSTLHVSHHCLCVPFYSEVCPGRRTALDPVVPAIFRLVWSGQEEPGRREEENIEY